jgi:hypothetical protein
VHDDHERGEQRPGVVACPPLAELLESVAAADRANARTVELLTRLHATGECEATTGVAVETWLLSAGLPASDRRMLDTATVQLGRLPAVADGFASGLLSWGQVRTICLLTERLSTDDATEFDLTLAPAIDRYADADPDGLLQIARQIVDRLRPDQTATEAARVEREAFVSLQPRLDGTGGKFHGDLDGLGFGLVAAALTAGAPLPGRRRDLIGRPPAGIDHDGDGGRDRMVRLGRHRADRLVQLCADDLARHGNPLTPKLPLAADAPPGAETGADGAFRAGGAADTAPGGLGGATDTPARPVDAGGIAGEPDRTRALVPEAILVIDEAQLTGADGLPVELLTRLTGGRLKVSGPTARRWLDEAGCRLRTIVLDDTGQVLGVGRAARFAPGWLTDANRATDATCQAPGCRTAASVCDLDHHRPWHPTRADQPAGTTDAVNLGPLCHTDNDAKQTQGWQVHRRDDGTIGWDHPRSGLTVRTLPWAATRAAARPPLPPGRRPRSDRPPRAPRPQQPSSLERRLARLLTRARDPDPPPF